MYRSNETSYVFGKEVDRFLDIFRYFARKTWSKGLNLKDSTEGLMTQTRMR